ncbi:MAG: 6-carboxytetrahydropterin synthase QueD [Desulfobacterales bacterium]|nr:6-carboxytetrahydropterin synthase QueD [Desulfobacterales bacterium]
MFELKVINQFAAAHRLKMVEKKCENLHGHNWKVEVSIIGEKLNEGGVLLDFGEIKEHLGEIINTLDHSYLNEFDDLKGKEPSSENIAYYIANKLQNKIKNIDVKNDVRVFKVEVWESDNASASYII